MPRCIHQNADYPPPAMWSDYHEDVDTTMSVIDLLSAADTQAVDGVLYNGNATKRHFANNVLSALNQAGGIPGG